MKQKLNETKVEFVDEELPQYEQNRLKNIADRKRKFDDLKLKAETVSTDYNVGSKRNASKRGLSAADKTPRQATQEPVRKSLRLQRIDADTGLTLPEKEPTRYHIIDEDPVRPPLTELSLDDLCNNNDQDDITNTAAYFNHKVKPFIAGNYKPITHLKEENFKKLTIKPELVAKVVPNRIFSLAIHPTETKLLLATGGKWGSIGFWDVHDNESKTHGVQVIKHHCRPINCLTFDNVDPSKLISTSYDGTVRIFDINEQKSSVLFGFPEDDSSYTTYHSQLSAHCFLVALGRSGLVGLVDQRISNTKTASNFKVYDKASPKMVCCHPMKKDIFVSPSSKGDCGLYDMRRGGSGNKLMTPISSLVGHTRAISSALFSPLSGSRVVTVAYDNKLRLFDTTSCLDTSLQPLKSIPHNNQTGRWLTTFKAEWHPMSDEMFFVGSMNQPRQIDVYTVSGKHYNLKGEDLGSVCSIVKCHPTQDIVVGGNSSGRVHVFM